MATPMKVEPSGFPTLRRREVSCEEEAALKVDGEKGGRIAEEEDVW